jgi:putative CocE/NonD family hydrolase
MVLRRLAVISAVVAVVAQTLTQAPLVAAPSPFGAWKPRPATYGTVAQTDVPIKMSDGTTLYADVIRPAGKDGKPAPGRFPVILTQTPYNKNSGTLAFRSDYLVTRGYVQVIADVRGTGSSEGKWDSFGKREQKDGYELAQWATSRKRPWSNGKLGLYGTSYAAINQLFTAAQHPRGLKALFPIVPMSDAYRDVSGSGGQVNTSFIPLWLGLVSSLGTLPPTYSPSNPAEWAKVATDHVQGALNFQTQAVTSAMTGDKEAYDGPFYRTRSPIEVIDKVTAPTFVTGGWFDLFQRGEPLLFQHLQQDGVPTKLLMGPWYHITAGQGLPADGVPSLDALSLRWFDHYLRKAPDAALDHSPDVVYYENGEGHYHTAPSWPPPSTHYRQEFLSGPSMPGSPGTLESSAPSSQGADVLPWQPASGACSRTAVQWSAGAGAGSPCETDNEMNDATGLTYDMKVPEDLHLQGPLSARLFVGTNGHDSQLTVRVEDVDPNGRATQLSAGWNVLSLRALDRSKSEKVGGLIVRPYHPFTKASVLPVKDGKVYEVYVEVFPTAGDILKGHSLRLSIQPSDAPHLTPPVPQAETEAGGVLSLYHSAKYPSELILPVSH